MSSDRYYGYGHAHNGGRPLSYNPATTSVPTSVGYNTGSSMYAGDMHVLPSSSSSTRHHLTPRGYYTSTAPSGVPTTTRTFAVNHDPRSRSTRETSRTRRSTLDSTSRAPVIVTTSSHKDRANTTSSHSSGTRSANSPTRDDPYYGSSSTSRASRHHGRTSSATYDDDYYRHRDSSLSRRDADAYRNSRPSVVYPSDPRHSTAAVDFGGGDYGTDGYQYTNAGELARYDLDNPRASRRRRDSTDRGYYRPSLSYNTDQRSLNVNTSPDLSRNYTSNTSRVYDGRGGPPPSTRGFDRINGRYDTPRDGPQAAAPVPPSPTSASNFEVANGPSRRGRPVSMYQDGTPRSGMPDDYYRARDDERAMRDGRDREPDRPSSSGFHDDSVASRGFGLRTGPPPTGDPQDRRREPRPDDPAKRSDESLKRDSDTERRERRHDRGASDDIPRERRETRRASDEEEKERTRLRDKVTGGLGIAAAAMGLGSAFKDDDKETKEKETQPRRRTSPSDGDMTPKDVPPADAPKQPDPDSRPRERSRERKSSDEELGRQRAAAEAETRDRMRRDAEDRLTGEAVAPASGSDSDEGRRARRRHRPSNSFNPNDASDLNKIKEQLAAMRVSDEGRRSEPAAATREDGARSDSEMTMVAVPRDESRGRDASVSADGKQVRLVSPPRDKKNDKPVRGILKQPKAAFPEDANPIREGVAPHKEDKKLKEVPAGARWTKISRRKVNPEALEIGKERFEVRDDFVIVLRVLSAEEIQAYATATQILRGMPSPNSPCVAFID